MPKSKEIFLEPATGRMSHCYKADPTTCKLHLHLNPKDVLQSLKATDVEGLELKELELNVDIVTIDEYGESHTVHISTIAELDAFYEAVANKHVMSQTHSEFPYTIFKYSQSTVFEQNWNDVTLAARGLIVNHETGDIVARPFSKFFNYNEGSAPVEMMQGTAIVTEKLDGSLGISYLSPDGELHIASSGSFESEQAQHANEIYNERYKGRWNPNPQLTYMWEIIYPENRIVVDYGDEDDLHLLGAVDKKTGRSFLPSELPEWEWKKATEYNELDSLDKVINSGERENREGFIVYFPETGARVKYKHEDYVKRHRYATGLNKTRLWEMLRNGDDFEDMRKSMPEEFNSYVDTTTKELVDTFTAKKNGIVKAFSDFKSLLPEGTSQKDFALKVQSEVASELRPYFFTLWNSGTLDGKAETRIWDSIKPPFEKSMWSSRGEE